MKDSARNASQHTGIRADLTARFLCLLDAAVLSVSSAESRLSAIGVLLPRLPRTSHGLILRVQFALVQEQARSLGRAIALLEAVVKDVDDLSS